MTAQTDIRKRSPAIVQCEGKVKFITRRMAVASLKRIARSLRKAREPYACRYCGGWHVGAASFKEKRPKGQPDAED